MWCEEVAQKLVGAGDLDGGDAYGETGARLGLLFADAAEEPGHGRRHKPRLPSVGPALSATAAHHGPRFAESCVSEREDTTVGAVDDSRDDVAEHRAGHVHLVAVGSNF